MHVEIISMGIVVSGWSLRGLAATAASHGWHAVRGTREVRPETIGAGVLMGARLQLFND